MAKQGIPVGGTYPAKLDIEIRFKGRGLRRIFGHPIGTFPARFEMRLGHGVATSIDYRRDLATALREAAAALDAGDD